MDREEEVMEEEVLDLDRAEVTVDELNMRR